MDPAGLARGQAPGPQRGRRVPTLAPGTPGSVWAEPARLSLIAGHAHPCRIRTSSQPDPARGMTRIRQTRLRETQGTSNRLGDRRSSEVCGGCGQIGQLSGWRGARQRPGRPRFRVVWCGRTRLPLGFSVMFVFRQLADSAAFSSMFRLVVVHLRERMPVSRASPASQAPCPARRAAARHGGRQPGDRGGDRGGRRCRLRDGIRQRCACRLFPATTWPLRRGRRCGCCWAGP
jgi:hypothetical protein